jgi:hypothetical protein
MTAGIINFFLLGVIIWLSTFMADSVLFFSTAGRWFVLILNSGVTLFFAYFFFLSAFIDYLRLSRSHDLLSVTKQIGRMYPSIRDTLTNAYQLINRLPVGSSNALREHAIKRFSDSISDTSFTAQLKWSAYLLPFNLIVPVFVGSILLLVLLPDMLGPSIKRILDPAGDYMMVPAYKIRIFPGDVKIISGKSLDIRAQYQGPEIEKCLLIYSFSDNEVFQSITMEGAAGHFQTRLQNIKKPLTYYVRAVPLVSADWKDKLISEEYDVSTLVTPVIDELSVVIDPPAYTGMPEKLLDLNVGDILTYPGSHISLSAKSSKPILTAKLVFSDSSEITGQIRENKFSVQFRTGQNLTYSVIVSDQEKLVNQDPIVYTITILDDIYPAVEVIDPGEDIELAADGALNLLIEGHDDFGFTSLSLHYQILGKSPETSDSTWQKIQLSIPRQSSKNFQQTYLWNFALLPVGFEDAVKYFVSLTDNDNISGPKEGRSGFYYIHFPSLDQLFSEFEMQQDENIQESEALTSESEELKKNLEEISREMKRENEINWERKRSIESSLEKQKKIQEKLEKIEQNLNKSIDKMEKNELFSPEIVDKYHQLQALFQEIATPELLQAMQEVQKSVDELNQKNAQQSMEKFKINQEQFKKNLERTLALFNKVKLEQELDRLIKMSEVMTNEQHDISDKLNEDKSLEQPERQNLIQKTAAQQEKLKQMQKALDLLLQNKDLKNYPSSSEELSDARSQTNQIGTDLNNTTDQLSRSEEEQAGQTSARSEQGMSALHQKLQNAQTKMQKADRENISTKMEKITDNLLKLSEQEEALIERTNKLSDYSDQFPEVAQSQQQLLENMNHVAKDILDLSHETFFLPPGIGQSLGSAHGNMNRSLSELENRRQETASAFQRQSMSGLNMSVLQMQQAMQAMGEEGSALGFEQFLKKMQQLSDSQGQLNQEGMNFFNQNQGSLSIEQQSQLKRMAAEQQAIRNSMDQLGQEVNNRSDVLGDLDNLAQEMEEVVKDLNALKIDRQTIERQQKILSRMLDAQKSVREQEYSKQRLAEIGQEYKKKSPDQPRNFEDLKLKQLNLDLLRALQEGYGPDYERIIETYFKELNADLSK